MVGTVRQTCKNPHQCFAMPTTLFLHFFFSSPITSSLNPPFKIINLSSKQNPSLTTTKITELTPLSDPNAQSNAAIKVPTAPWMKGPLVLQPHEILNLSKPRHNKPSKSVDLEKKSDKALTGKESGVRGMKAMKRIVKSIDKMRKHRDNFTGGEDSEESDIGEGFEMLGREDGDVGGTGTVVKKLPWVRNEKVVYWRMKKEKVVTKAELILDKELLERLREEAARMRIWVKVMKAGVTQSVVDEIRSTWRENELAVLKFSLPLCRNMDRAREIVEMKTGGLVVWTRKDSLVIYRGCSYPFTKGPIRIIDGKKLRKDGKDEFVSAGVFLEKDANSQRSTGSLFESETDRLLDGLGPRFVDWWMRKPLPVDGDLLPEVVNGFTPPSRHSPPHVRSELTNDELTYLRKVAHGLPTHFVLGRNRKLQGLAAAILKLWEKSIIAKIAVKWGVPNTNNEQMAYELKYLTGGVLLLRNKFFIILYRGKDFLPCQVSNSILNRESELREFQLNEETARMKGIENLYIVDGSFNTNNIGTLHEFHDIEAKFGDLAKSKSALELRLEVEREQLESELRNHEHKLSLLERKIEKSERELLKLRSAQKRASNEQDTDPEIMTEEERECLRKIGLKMHSSLVLGRRGIFDGVMEGLHQHWKYREVVKVITMQRRFSQVMYTANFLEGASGGILVSVDKLKDGHAIVIYRGKNYRRPRKHLSKNLLTKREALHRSLLVQRIGSLKFFTYQTQCAIKNVKHKLAELPLESSKQIYEPSDIAPKEVSCGLPLEFPASLGKRKVGVAMEEEFLLSVEL